MNYDAYGNPIKPKTTGVVLPLLLALLASGGGNYWLWKERSKVSGELFSATAKLAATEAVQKETVEKLASLEAERTTLIEAKEQAVKDAQARALELARLKDDVAGVLPKESEADADKADKKADKKDEAKADAKDDKKADAKAETKAEKKAKAKARKKAAASDHKSKAKEKDKKGGDDDAPAAREL